MSEELTQKQSNDIEWDSIGEKVGEKYRPIINFLKEKGNPENGVSC